VRGRRSRAVAVNLHLTLLLVYSIGVVALGLWTARLVRGSQDFFVGGRTFGPGLLMSTMLAANIGAASTVGVAGKAYQEGISAWWWVGSAGIGSMLFAFTVAPALWRLAKAHDFYTTGDYLEFRYGVGVRTALSIVICLAALVLLAGQLLAGATILNVIVGIPIWAGALVGAAIMTVYFAAGGLLGSAWVNSLQLVVMLTGFLLALPVVLENAGGLAGVAQAPGAPPFFGTFVHSSGPGSGWMFLVLTAPSFLISPGLIQKAYSARSEPALKTGIALNAIVLMLFAFIPVLFGMAARSAVPGIASPNDVLPTFLMTALPVWLGALALSAVFSTEVDTCDTILFMLSTAISNDVYKRHLNPAATDAELLRVARMTAAAGGAAGVALSLVVGTVLGAVTIFYQVMVVTFFVPIVGGLYVTRMTTAAAVASIGAGLAGLLLAYQVITPAFRWADPVLVGVFAAVGAAAVVTFAGRAQPARVET
jgi:solute:Na+ symporter, SSS family